MAKSKKYYWLKLQKDFFKRHDIRIIEGMPNGKDYILFYLKLLTESISHEGELRFSDTIPYSVEMLSTITHTNVDVVKAAINIFTELNMMEMYDDGTIYMNEIQKMIGEETDWARQKREYRESQKQLKNRTMSGKKKTMSDKSKSKSKSKSIDIKYIVEILDYMNTKLNTHYQTSSQKTQSLISARMNSGFTVDDFKKVIDIKYAEWKDTEYAKYLRPETLFGTKFESYLNQKSNKDEVLDKFLDDLKGD